MRYFRFLFAVIFCLSLFYFLVALCIYVYNMTIMLVRFCKEQAHVSSSSPSWLNQFIVRYKTAYLGILVSWTGLIWISLDELWLKDEWGEWVKRLGIWVMMLGLCGTVTLACLPLPMVQLLATISDRSPLPFIVSSIWTGLDYSSGKLADTLEYRCHQLSRIRPNPLPAEHASFLKRYDAVLVQLPSGFQKAILELEKALDTQFETDSLSSLLPNAKQDPGTSDRTRLLLEKQVQTTLAQFVKNVDLSKTSPSTKDQQKMKR
jgi:hypothetical protein